MKEEDRRASRPLSRGLLTREGALALRVSPGFVEVDAEDAPEPWNVYRNGVPIGQLLELDEGGMISLSDLRAALVDLQAQEANTRPIPWLNRDGTSITTKEVLAGFDADDLEMVQIAESVHAVARRCASRDVNDGIRLRTSTEVSCGALRSGNEVSVG